MIVMCLIWMKPKCVPTEGGRRLEIIPYTTVIFVIVASWTEKSSRKITLHAVNATLNQTQFINTCRPWHNIPIIISQPMKCGGIIVHPE